MRLIAYSSLTLTRFVALTLWMSFCALIIAAPVLANLHAMVPSLALYAALSPICHQVPERSFALAGIPWAVCQRCSGLYLGLAVACCFPSACYVFILNRRRLFVIAGVSPAVVDFSLNYVGVWANTPPTRFLTGFVLGLTLSALLVPGLSELVNLGAARFRSRSAPMFGGS